MISICIVNYRNQFFTDFCLESLKKTTYKDKEILLHDNSKNNLGFPVACNLLAKKAKGDYLFFLNNDTLVKKDIFERLLESSYDITGCKRFNYKGTKELESGFSVDKFGFPAGKTGSVFYPDGALFMRTTLYKALGGFDEKTFMYGEDRDFCWRAWLAGYSTGISEKAVFYHSSHSAMGSVNYTRRYHSEKNTIRYMLKNYTIGSLIKILPQYMFWSILEIGFILFSRPMAIFKSYLPAYWWNISNLRDTLSERKKVIHRIPDSELPFSKVLGKLYVLRTQRIKWTRLAQ